MRSRSIKIALFFVKKYQFARTDCERPCFDQLKQTHLTAPAVLVTIKDVCASANQNMARHNRPLDFFDFLKNLCQNKSFERLKILLINVTLSALFSLSGNKNPI